VIAQIDLFAHIRAKRDASARGEVVDDPKAGIDTHP